MKTFQTDHFTLQEFTKSSTATALRIDNTPSERVINNLYNLVTNVLEPARVELDSPIIISSGYRCLKLNRVVGGVSTSQHLRGEAADLQCKDIETLKKLFIILQDYPVDQLLYEYSYNKNTQKTVYWIHVSHKSLNNRHDVRDNFLAIPSKSL